jgi:RNA polymerase sigma-70 factor (ECF subfamily)
VDEERYEEDQVHAALAHDLTDSSLEWLEEIYREHAGAVLRVAWRITGNPEDAEDVLHTVFLRLARRPDPPDLAHGALPYLRRAATNAALDLIASRKVRSGPDFEDAAAALPDTSTPTQERQQWSRELRTALREGLATLSRRGAEMFTLRYFEGLDNRAIAELFGTSPGTVAVTLHRARTQLMTHLQPMLGGSP